MIGPCPPAAVLGRLLQDELPAPELGAVEAHVETCNACQSALDTLSGEPIRVEAPRNAPPITVHLDRIKRRGPAAPGKAQRPAPDRGGAAGDGEELVGGLPVVTGFRLLRAVGHGGLETVYEAIDGAFDRRVALKVVARAATRSVAAIERFRREARVIALLNHPHIVPILGVGEDGPWLAYSMQFIEGEALDRIVARRRGGGVGLAATGHRAVALIAVQVAGALAHAHQLGILHRDVRPANILIDERGSAWLAGFRLIAPPPRPADAAEVGDLRDQTSEQADYRSGVRRDVQALGSILYELLTLRHPAAAPDPAVPPSRQGPPRPGAIDRTIPRDLDTIVMQAIAEWPAPEYANAAALAEDLRRHLAAGAIRGSEVGPARRAWRWVHRHRAAGVVAVLVVGLLVGVALAVF